MNLGKLFENVTFKSFAPGSEVRGKLGKTDLGILKVSSLIAEFGGDDEARSALAALIAHGE